jgi:hypothetical protein
MIDDGMTGTLPAHFVGFDDLVLMARPIGATTLRARILRDPRFPRPIMGGQVAGSKAIWSRAAAESALERIAREGFDSVAADAAAQTAAV